MQRTKYCGLFGEEDVGKQVTAMGWVQTRRDMGGVIFLDLRDREGFCRWSAMRRSCRRRCSPRQSICAARASFRSAEKCISERKRHTTLKLPTGTVELRAERLVVLSEAEALPFPVENELPVREELRLKYRFLDLRRPVMLENLRFRHKVQRVVEEYLDGEGLFGGDPDAHQEHARKAAGLSRSQPGAPQGSSLPCPSRPRFSSSF